MKKYKQISVSMPKHIKEKATRMAKALRISRSELIRRLIDADLKKNGKTNNR